MMKTWYTRELSKLANVSVRTLHYYDQIGLLKPSIRADNNYRLYSEKDLLRLQQIIALKFFGFGLAQIKQFLSDHKAALNNFAIQARLLKKKSDALSEASDLLQRISNDCLSQQSIPWETIIKSIEVYHMTEQLDHDWVKEIFTQEELAQYTQFETELKANSGAQGKAAFENKWRQLVDNIVSQLDKDPTSAIGIDLGGQCMTLIHSLYGKKYAHLRNKIFERGFGEGLGLDKVGLTPETVTWLEQAVHAYWRQRIMTILEQIDQHASSELQTQWYALMDEMYGEEQERKNALVDIVLSDNQVSDDAKRWLKTLM